MTIFTIAIHTVDPPLYSFPVVAGKKNLLLLETFLHGTRIVLNVVFDKVYD